MTNQSYKRVMEVVAAADDGTTYRIDRYCRSQAQGAEKTAEDRSNAYCCLPDGQLVQWRGDGNYQLPDGTLVTTVATRLCE
ncbi:hypothetical protein [Achromobacter sp.]|uniref:hypothetical protein n=1 Tax=Achromobacter sp. TaxID=134375 RepID=UPI0028AEB4D0|nr:hypothetical protein [Achromobacter sp.]